MMLVFTLSNDGLLFIKAEDIVSCRVIETSVVLTTKDRMETLKFDNRFIRSINNLLNDQLELICE